VVEHRGPDWLDDRGLAEVERGRVGVRGNELFVEHARLGEEIVHPCATEWLGHDMADVGDAVRGFDLRGLLGSADGFAIRSVVRH
jgi:hypothetical protein